MVTVGTRLFLIGVIAIITVCGCAETPVYSVRTLRVPAATGTTNSLLGRPVDADFGPISGEEGRSLFPDGKITESPDSEVSHKLVIFREESELKANLSVWNLAGAGVNAITESRFASLRAYQISKVATIDDTTEMRAPSANAAYYVSRIFFGHLYEAVLWGAATDFSAGVIVKIPEFYADLGYLESSNNLKVEVFARGVKNISKKALYVESLDDFKTCYEPDYSHPVPIFVEYRSIPTRKPQSAKEIVFKDAPQFATGSYLITVDRVSVRPVRPTGSRWDAVFGGPDLYVTVSQNECQDEILMTVTKPDSLWASWSGARPAPLTARSRICVKIWDEDLGADELIGTCITDDLGKQPFDGNRIRLQDCGQVEELTLTVVKR